MYPILYSRPMGAQAQKYTIHIHFLIQCTDSEHYHESRFMCLILRVLLDASNVD